MSTVTKKTAEPQQAPPTIPIARPQLGQEEQDAVAAVIASGHIASGPVVAAFEKEFAKKVDTAHAVACNNGTTALHAALEALGVGPGDKVIVPAFTFIATANAVLYTGATPVFVDVDLETFLLDTHALERSLGDDVKAIIPVHLYGQAADMTAIMRLAGERDIPVLGDAAQAHGALSGGRPVGSLGTCETFSFYPTKNMTCGEGGMITTDDADLAARLRSIVNHGRAESRLGTYDHLRRGHNFRLTDLHAAIGRVQLGRLDGYNERRRAIAKQYDAAFSRLSNIAAPKAAIGNVHVYHQYTLRCRDRSKVVDTLKGHGVGSAVYYPRALHQYPHLEQYGHSRLATSEKLAESVLSIPVHPGLSDDDVERVVKAVTAADKAA